MQKLSFKKITIFFSFIVTVLFVLIILTLFFSESPNELYKNIISQEMLFSVKLTLETSLISTFVVLFVSLPVAYALSRYDFFGKTLLKTLISLPLAFPELILGFCLLIFFGPHWVGGFLSRININVALSKTGVVVAQIFTALPYGIKVLYSTFENIDVKYEKISLSLGYSRFETFKNIVLPMSKNGIIASLIITFARSFGAFGAVFILAGGILMKTETLPITFFINISYGNENMVISSGIVIVMIFFITTLLFEILERKKHV